LGSIKNVNGFDVYVKGHFCDENLKALYKDISKGRTNYVKLLLGRWKILRNDLLPLLIFHYKDKKLSYFNVKILVKLTEIPDEDFPLENKDAYLDILRSYKEEFTSPKPLEILMEHLAYCLQVE
jgi:hypothetical protein